MTKKELPAPTVQKFSVADLLSADYNPRFIDEKALKGLQDSLKRFGVLELPIVNIRGEQPRLIGGHQRIKSLRRQGVKYVDCVVVDFDESTEMAANLALNNPAIQGVFDVSKSIPLVDAVAAKLPQPDLAGFQDLAHALRAKASKIQPAPEPQEQEGEEQEQKEPEYNSVPGTVYELGVHRLYCGGFQEGVPLLTADEQAAACITDPPYGVSYKQVSTGDSLENDDLSGEAWTEFLEDFAKVTLAATDGPCYVFMSSSGLPDLEAAWAKHQGVVQRWLAWVKDRFTLSRGDYQHQFELALYGHRAGVDLTDPPLARTNLLAFPKPKSNPLHPTMKPPELIKAIMEDSTEAGALVLDPCVGSGTTLVVAESIGRVCYACELDPKYADVVRQRWAEMKFGAGTDWVERTPPLD